MPMASDDAELDLDLLAASLRADSSDLGAFVESLAVKLEEVCRDGVRVERRRAGLFGPKLVRRIALDAGDERLELDGTTRRVIETRRARLSGGIVLKSEPLDTDAGWPRSARRSPPRRSAAQQHGRRSSACSLDKETIQWGSSSATTIRHSRAQAAPSRRRRPPIENAARRGGTARGRLPGGLAGRHPRVRARADRADEAGRRARVLHQRPVGQRVPARQAGRLRAARAWCSAARSTTSDFSRRTGARTRRWASSPRRCTTRASWR